MNDKSLFQLFMECQDSKEEEKQDQLTERRYH